MLPWQVFALSAILLALLIPVTDLTMPLFNYISYFTKPLTHRVYFNNHFLARIGKSVAILTFALFHSVTIAQTPGSLTVIEDSVSGVANLIDLNATALGSIPPLTFVSFQLKAGEPSNGQLIPVSSGADGKYYYIPNPDFFGSDTFEWNGTDTNLNVSNNYTFSLSVTAVDDPPRLFAGTGSAKTDANGSTFPFNENQTLASTISISDPDTTSFTLPVLDGADKDKFVVTTDPNDAFTFYISTNSALDFDNPPAGQTSFSLDVNVTDGTTPVTQQINLTLQQVNEPPTFSGATSLTLAMSEDGVPTPWPTPTLYASDQDGDSLGWAITSPTSGTATLNVLDASSREVTYTPNADFFGSDSFNVTVTANKQSTTKNIIVNVAAVDDDNPVFTNPTYTFLVNENTTAVTTVTATDPDTKPITFTKDNSSDWSYFDLVNGAVTFKSPPDFETDPKSPGTYSIGVIATDGDNQNTSQTLTIGVLDVAENPKLSIPGSLTFPFPISLIEDGNWSWTSETNLVSDLNITDDDAGQSSVLAWSLSTSPSKGNVSISGTGSQPTTFSYVPDANQTGADTFVVKISDNTSPVPLTYEHNFSVTINPLADDPMFTYVGINSRQEYSVSAESNLSITLDENVSTIVFITAFDADATDVLTYTISGQDSGKFDINPTTGDLSFKVGQEPDFENPQDANSDGIYELIIQVSDNSNPILFDTLNVFINSRDRNEAPSGINPTSATILENTTFIVDLNASDVDYDDNNSNFVWSLDSANGDDTSKFAITTEGLLSFISAPNFESPEDADLNNTYNVGVKVTDSDGSFASTTFIVDVGNANDAPVISLPNSQIPVSEGVLSIYNFTGSDEDDLTSSLIWRISDGNTSLFSIDSASGLLRFVSTSVMPDLDFNATGMEEAAVAEKFFDLNVTVRDSNNTEDTKQVTVKVEQANDNPIVDSSFLTGGVISRSVLEDGNFSLALSSIVTDPEGIVMSYLVTASPSNGTHSINEVSGTLTYEPNADYSGPDDLNVTVTDSAGNSVILQIAIDITAVNDAPIITNYISAIQVNEGHSVEIYDFNTTDVDSDDNSLTFGLSSPDSSRFTINPTSGSLIFASLPDYENPGDTSGDNIYDINVTVTDLEGAVSSRSFSVSIRNVNEPPTLSGDTLYVSADEEELYSVNLNTYFGTQGGSLTFVKITSEQNGTSTLNGATGVLTYQSNQDFNGTDYLEINATDAGVSTTLKVDVTIFAVNDPPVITNKSNLSSQTQQLNENISTIIDLNVTDPNDSPASGIFSWSLGPKDSNVSHNDWNYFSINPSTGEISFTSPPNYEVDNSVLGTNIYEFVASVSDNQGGVETDSVSLRVQVMPVNETPSFSKSIEVLTTLEDVSVDGNLSSYFSDPDAGTSPQFVIASNPTSGTVQSFNAADGSFTYVPNANSFGKDTFDVNATDGVNAPISIQVDFIVTSVNDEPAITVDYATPIPVVENVSMVWDLNVTDTPDNNVATSYLWSIGPLDGNSSHTDYIYFTIDDSNGSISFISAPDFDTDNSVANTNIYEFSVTVSDLGGTSNGGAQSHTINLKVRVTDGDESPILYIDKLRTASTTSLTVPYVINEDTPFTDSNFSQYAVDPEAKSLSWTIVPRAGTLGSPVIGSANGILSYTPPVHYNGNDVFDVNVSDPSGNTAQIIVDVVINPLGDNPYFVWPGGKTVNDFYTIEVEEGKTEVLDFNASDSYDFKGDYNASTANYYWSINNKDGNTSHLDVNFFKINPSSGLVSFRNPADMEENGSVNPGDYEFDVVVGDKSGLSATHSVTVKVVPVNEAPVLSILGNYSIEINEDNSSSFALTATDPEGDSISWSTSITPNGTAIYSTQKVTYIPNLNFTGQDSFDVNATDDSGLSSTLRVNVNVLAVNDAPTLSNPTTGPVSFPENSTDPIVSYNVTDVESDNSVLSLSLSGPDAELFYVSKSSSGTGDCNATLHFFHPPNFEIKKDVGTDGYYNVNIVIKDEGGPLYEAIGEEPVLIFVSDVQEAPLFDYNAYPQSFPIEFAEDNSSTFTLQVRDPDFKSGLAWNIPSLTEKNASLTASTSVPSTGLAQADIVYSPVLNFVGDDNVTISATDADGQSVSYNFTFRVSPANDQPVFTYNPTDGVILVPENNSTVYNFDAIDSEDGNTNTSGFFWKIMDGNDRAEFNIAADGVLTFDKVPNYEIPSDTGGDNQYEVVIGVSDDDLTFRTQSLLVKVLPENDPPSFTPFDTNGSFTMSISENVNLSSQFVIAATDVEQDGISFSLISESPQNNNSLFEINVITGAVSFIDGNYENFEGNSTQDPSQDNHYLIEVNATDNGIPAMSSIQTFSLLITDTDEAPVFGSLSPSSIDENQSGVFFTPQVDHADVGQTLRFELVESNDYFVFELNSTETGAFRFKSEPNYENPLDAEKDNQYNATLRVYDSNLSTAVPVEKTFSITVNDSNEAPVLTNPSPTFWFNYRHPEGDKKVIVLEEYLIDVDGGTGLDDLIASGTSGIMVENDLSGYAFSSSSLVTVQNSDVLLSLPADFNQDGIQDLLIMGANSVSWYEGNVSAVGGDFKSNFSSMGEITGTNGDGAPHSIEIADFNGDGNEDFVVSFANTKLKWFANNGDSTFSAGREIASAETRSNHLQYLKVGDLNGDLQPDVFGVFPNENKLVWYENVGSSDASRFDGNASIIFQDANIFKSPRKAQLADMDNDGTMDLIASSFSNPKIMLFKNDGSGNFASPLTLIEKQGSASALTVGNFDGDEAGLLDVAYALLSPTGTGEIKVSMQTSLDTFSPSSVISVSTSSVVADDLVSIAFDNDSNLDLVALYRNEGVIRLFRNGGDNTFSSVGGDVNGFDGAAHLRVADFDIDKDPITYSLVNSEGDSAKFEIFNPKTGDLRFKLIPDFENPSSNSNDNSYKVVIQASDGDKKTTKELYINVTDKNEAPVFKNISFTTPYVPENTSFVATLEFDDNEDNQLYTFSLEGPDKDLFKLETTSPLKSPNAYALSFKDGFFPSFEDSNDSNGDKVYDVAVRVQDDGDLSSLRSFSVNILDQDDPPFFTQFPAEPIALSEDSISTDWNAPSLFAIDLEDNASVNPILWSVSIPPSHGDANFSNPLDPSSLVYVPVANYYGSDQFTIRIDDTNTTNATVERVLHISVAAVNDAPTDNLPTSEILVPENTRSVLNILDYVSDIDGNITALLVDPKGSNDNNLFEIDPLTQELRFRKELAPPDYETPQDLSSGTQYDNIYIAEFRLRDPNIYPPQQLQVRVTNENDAPVFTTSETTISLTENSTWIQTFQAKDNDNNQTLIYSVSGGEDRQFFEFRTNGELHFKTAPDFENPKDLGGTQIFDNIYDVTIQVSDSGVTPQSSHQSITVIILDSNDPPSFPSVSQLLVNENATFITKINAFDPDFGDKITYSLLNAGSSPAKIDSTTGDLSLKQSFDYEIKGIYSFTITVNATDDDNLTTTQDFTVSLNNLNDNIPILDLNLTGAKFIHYEFSGPVTKVSGSDADKDIISYQIGGGLDRQFFTINQVSGELSFRDPYSFDSNNSLDGDDLYQVGIRGFDGSRYSPLYLIEVDLRPIDKTPPRITDEDGIAKPDNVTFTPRVNENDSFVYKLIFNDTETSNVIVSLEGQDQQFFTFDENSSTLSFITPPDFESGKIIYQVDVVLSNLPGSGIVADGQHVSVAAFYIIVQPVDEAPVLTNPTTQFTLEEDSQPVLLDLTATDQEFPASAVQYIASSPSNGQLSGVAPQFFYTPNPNFNGVDQFNLTLLDNNQNSVVRTISLLVNSVNDQPTAVDDSFTNINYTFGNEIVLPVLDNDLSAPDLNENLTLTSFSSLLKWTGDKWNSVSGTISLNNSKTELLFLPLNEGLGLYKFSYSMSDGVYTSSANVEVVVEKSTTLPGWNYTKNFGFYSNKENQWIFHSELGWLNIPAVNGEKTFTWMWSETLGWIWTGGQHPTRQLSFPYFYSEDLSVWCNILFLDNGLPKTLSSGNWIIYKYETNGSTLTLSSNEFIQMRNELLVEKNKSLFQAQLNSQPNLNSAIQFIRDSSLFTSIEKDTIELQILFTGKSSILDNAGISLSF